MATAIKDERDKVHFISLALTVDDYLVLYATVLLGKRMTAPPNPLQPSRVKDYKTLLHMEQLLEAVRVENQEELKGRMKDRQ